MERLIFLDFDGVLRRITSEPLQFDRDCLECFESAVRQCSGSGIVIASSWRQLMPLQEMRDLFSVDVAELIIGATPENLYVVAYGRYAETMSFLEERRLTAMPWVAVDDNRLNYPEDSPVLFTDPLTGFDAECSTRLVQMLQGQD